jgi:hypothetical protein
MKTAAKITTKTIVQTAVALGLAITLLIGSARPAACHERNVRDPEPEHLVSWIANVLYPVGHLLGHIIIGRHEKIPAQDASEPEPVSMEDSVEMPAQPAAEPAVEKEKSETKYNFGPRKKKPQQ